MRKTIIAIALATGLGGTAFTAIAQDEGVGTDDPGMHGQGPMMEGGMMQDDMMKTMSEMRPMMEDCHRMMSTMLEKSEEGGSGKSPSNG